MTLIQLAVMTASMIVAKQRDVYDRNAMIKHIIVVVSQRSKRNQYNDNIIESSNQW